VIPWPIADDERESPDDSRFHQEGFDSAGGGGSKAIGAGASAGGGASGVMSAAARPNNRPKNPGRGSLTSFSLLIGYHACGFKWGLALDAASLSPG
jgi:hypothetical protein